VEEEGKEKKERYKHRHSRTDRHRQNVFVLGASCVGEEKDKV
jgi:hypothetical protein